MLTYRQFIIESINDKQQETVAKLQKELAELTDEQAISKLKATIEILQNKLSKS